MLYGVTYSQITVITSTEYYAFILIQPDVDIF